MKKLLLLIAFITLTSLTVDKEVYICQSKGGKKYHFTKDCRGLSNCKAEIVKVKLSEAEKQGKTLCGYED
ncbi:hypothetical protein OGH69_05680 [Flavobacterium sp. MFBS3-15]|uniref:hypothetical protein n=1 Tax=Flavobacterium sp. MFBS3-15 TaxID=2989816 RepID=UPI0022356ED2|nr:hypothetical protein [Flavobacterium sp. MFBS3-15]MCW4468447.1 hypothetical protein [Flavobacterium sp. MFBS3-15]